ncbi:hypothetical protein B0H13DRAFT_1564723, partial [Mycena leptocephala]
SNLTAVEGANMWKQYLEPVKSRRNVRLGSPAPSGAVGSIDWLTNFMTACGSDCSVDFLVLHQLLWDERNRFREFLEKYHDIFQLSIWVTEWACQNMAGPQNQCSVSEVTEFMKATQAFMNEMEWVERYS